MSVTQGHIWCPCVQVAVFLCNIIRSCDNLLTPVLQVSHFSVSELEEKIEEMKDDYRQQIT